MRNLKQLMLMTEDFGKILDMTTGSIPFNNSVETAAKN